MSWKLPYDTLSVVTACLYPSYVGRLWAGETGYEDATLDALDLSSSPLPETLRDNPLKAWLDKQITPEAYRLPQAFEISIARTLRNDYVLHERGLTLPLPDKPTSALAVARAFQALAVSARGELRLGDLGGIKAKRGTDARFSEDDPDPTTDPATIVRRLLRGAGIPAAWALRGAHVRRLRTALQATVTQAWVAERAYAPEEYAEALRSMYESALDTYGEEVWPAGLQVHIGEAGGDGAAGQLPAQPADASTQAYFTPLGWHIAPCPPPPAIEDYYREWADGTADMPIFSGCTSASVGTATDCCPPRRA